MRFRSALAVAGLVAVLFNNARQAYADDWVPLKSLEGNFSVQFPAAVKETVSDVETVPFVLKNHTFPWSGKNGREYCVVWCDYPKEMMAVVTPEQVFKGIIVGYHGKGKTFLSDKPITVGGNIGHDLEVDVGGGRIHRARLVMSGNRLFMAMTYATAAERKDPDIGKFLDSFAISDSMEFPQRGFRLNGVALAGWHWSLRDKGKTVVQWVSPESTTKELKGFVTVEMGVATEPSAEKTAASIAKDWGGQLADEKVTLDGEPGFRVTAKNSAKTLNPVEAIVLTHGGFLYMILGGATPGVDCEKPIADLIKSWKWCDMVSQADHLWFCRDAIPVFNGLAEMKMPADMFFHRSDTPEKVVDLSLNDPQNHTGSLQAFVQLQPLAPGVDFAEVKDKFLEQMNSKKLADAAFVWTRRGGDGHRLMTQTVASTVASGIAKHDAFVSFALIQLDAAHMVLVNFTIAPANEKERAKYEAAAEAMADSIRPHVGAGLPKK